MPHNQTQKKNPQTRRFVPAAACLLALCLLVLPAGANPPSDIALKYDPTTNQLSVTITHPVPDPAAHYIKNVKVNVNGKVVADKDYTSQPAKDTFTYTYQAPLQAGDTARVTATCSLAGSGEKVLEMPTPSATAPPAAPVSPAAAVPAPNSPVPQPTKSAPALLPFAGLAALGLIAYLKKRT